MQRLLAQTKQVQLSYISKCLNCSYAPTQFCHEYNSLANLPVGVYTLDVIAQKGNAKAAYEGILVVSQQPTTVINETTKQIINQEINQNTRVDVDTRIIFPPVKKPGNSNSTKPPVNDTEPLKYCQDPCNPSCRPYLGPCDNNGLPGGTNDTCEELYGKLCCNDPAYKGGDQECYDEGDLDDCEPGSIDKGNGCEEIIRCSDPEYKTGKYDTCYDEKDTDEEMEPPTPTDYCYPLSGVLPEGCTDELEENDIDDDFDPGVGSDITDDDVTGGETDDEEEDESEDLEFEEDSGSSDDSESNDSDNKSESEGESEGEESD